VTCSWMEETIEGLRGSANPLLAGIDAWLAADG
jgi:hypothetical protein